MAERQYWAKLTTAGVMRFVYFDLTPDGYVRVTDESLRAVYEGGATQYTEGMPERKLTYLLWAEILTMQGFQRMIPHD